ncbi:MAG: hypothetical protein C4321_10210, partial [Chloroflexota bacterium]
MIVLGYYDGPTAGVMKCQECGAEYRFDLFDWDEREEEPDVRVVAFRPLPPGSFAELVEALPKVKGAPSCPIGFPAG